MHPSTQSIRNFIPLITLLLIIIAATWYTSTVRETQTIMELMPIFMAYFFFIFGGFKVLKWPAFVMAYKKYDILAQKSTLYAWTYPLIEIALGYAYFYNIHPIATNSITLGIMIIGSLGVWRTLQKKEEVPCACLGTVFTLPMTKVTLMEDLLMAGMALVMLILLL